MLVGIVELPRPKLNERRIPLTMEEIRNGLPIEYGTADTLEQVLVHEMYRPHILYPDRKYLLKYRKVSHPERNYRVRNYIGERKTLSEYIHETLVEYEFEKVE